MQGVLYVDKTHPDNDLLQSNITLINPCDITCYASGLDRVLSKPLDFLRQNQNTTNLKIVTYPQSLTSTKQLLAFVDKLLRLH